jgi:hypothetical protein
MTNNKSAKVAIDWREMLTYSSRTVKSDLIGYRMGKEPDASWYRSSNHKRNVEILEKEQIERDKQLQKLNEAKKTHNERMKAVCEFFTPTWLFGAEHRKNVCDDDSDRPS